MPRRLTELDRKVFEYLLKKGDNGVPQNVLWKELGLTSRDASRSLKKLEEMGYVKREPIVVNGRRTYRVIPLKKSIEELEEKKEIIVKPILSLDGFTMIPCMYCPYIDQCYEGGYYDPTQCDLLINWVRLKARKQV
ncbi:MAG: winged helix-turn-helix transcriptional regulator [Thermoprotei archaeon]